MARTPPPLKKSNSARVNNGSAMPFSDAKIKGAVTKSSTIGPARREGFTKRDYTTPCGKPRLPKG